MDSPPKPFQPAWLESVAPASPHSGEPVIACARHETGAPVRQAARGAPADAEGGAGPDATSSSGGLDRGHGGFLSDAQQRRHASRPDEASVVNGLYIALYYTAGAAGSVLPLALYQAGGWTVFVAAMVLISAAGTLPLRRLAASAASRGMKRR